MANLNSQTSVASASGLTTGTASQFFTQTNIPGESVLAELNLTAAAETGSGTFTAFTSGGFEGGVAIVPTRFIVQVVQSITFTAGTTPTVTLQGLVNAGQVAAATALVSSGTTALVAGQTLIVNCAPNSSAAGVMKYGDLLKAVLAITGAPTNWSGALKVLAMGVVVPV